MVNCGPLSGSARSACCTVLSKVQDPALPLPTVRSGVDSWHLHMHTALHYSVLVSTITLLETKVPVFYELTDEPLHAKGDEGSPPVSPSSRDWY